MKQIIIFLLSVYQAVFSMIIRQLLGVPDSCRYNPSCSVYMKQMIRKHGVLKGGRLGLRQLLSCHPFGTYATI